MGDSSDDGMTRGRCCRLRCGRALKLRYVDIPDARDIQRKRRYDPVEDAVDFVW